MKKIALATLLVIMAATAGAVEVGGEYQNFGGKNGTASANNYQVFVKENLNNNFTVDAKATQGIAKTNDGISNSSMETGLTGKYNLGPVTPYTRIGLGEWYRTTGNFTYYSVEPGVVVPVSTTGLSASVGYRFRDGVRDSNEFTTRTWRAKIGYDLTKTDKVYVGYDRMRGDVKANVSMVGYSHSF